jgi:hypothetical protein
MMLTLALHNIFLANSLSGATCPRWTAPKMKLVGWARGCVLTAAVVMMSAAILMMGRGRMRRAVT